MAVMEVTLPSGYTADPDSIPNLRASPFVQRVETRDGDTVVVLYFDNVSHSNVMLCFRVYNISLCADDSRGILSNCQGVSYTSSSTSETCSSHSLRLLRFM
jgi:hypothetical protein